MLSTAFAYSLDESNGRLTMRMILNHFKSALSHNASSNTNSSKMQNKQASVAAVDGWDNVLY
jgi:hypothetical protein